MKILPNSKSCFVCGRENPNGLKKTFFSDGERVRTEFAPESWMVGYETVIHGGIISTLLDEIVIWAAYDRTGRFGVTAELNVRFRSPMLLGSVYTAEGWFVSDKGKLWLAESEIRDSKNKILASATAKIFPMSEDQEAAYRGALLGPE